MIDRRGFCGVIALLAITPTAALCQQRPGDVELATVLRKGGLVIVLRHGATNEDEADTDPLAPDNVAKQRRLSAKGEAGARDLGAAIRHIGVPVGRVITSQFDRAHQTARLAGLEGAEKSPDVTEGGLVDTEREQASRRPCASS